VAQVQPFPGLLYNVPQADLGQLLAPPYDVIPPAYQDELYARDPRNIVRVILNRTPGEAGYAEAGAAFARWRAEGVLAQDATPALYVLEQRFTAEGLDYERLGVLLRFRAEQAETGVIRPHEHTRAAAKEDRWKVLNATKANFSPIFLMVPDLDQAFAQLLGSARQSDPTLEYTDDGEVLHRLYTVKDAAAIAAYQQLLGLRPAYIADGHHRHATALRYAAEHGPDGAWTLGYFTPMGDRGLVVLPYHRILSSGPSIAEARGLLQPHFATRPLDSLRAAADAAQNSKAGYAFALAEPGGQALLVEAPLEARERLAGKAPSLVALDTYFLHHAVLEPLLGVPAEAVSYVHSLAEAEESVRHGRCRLAVLMRSTPVEQIVAVADARENMPAKSTFFHPKLPSGLVIHPLVV